MFPKIELTTQTISTSVHINNHCTMNTSIITQQIPEQIILTVRTILYITGFFWVKINQNNEIQVTIKSPTHLRRSVWYINFQSADMDSSPSLRAEYDSHVQALGPAPNSHLVHFHDLNPKPAVYAFVAWGLQSYIEFLIEEASKINTNMLTHYLQISWDSPVCAIDNKLVFLPEANTGATIISSPNGTQYLQYDNIKTELHHSWPLILSYEAKVDPLPPSDPWSQERSPTEVYIDNVKYNYQQLTKSIAVQIESFRIIEEAEPPEGARIPRLHGLVMRDGNAVCGILTTFIGSHDIMTRESRAKTEEEKWQVWKRQIEETKEWLSEVGLLWGEILVSDIVVDVMGEVWLMRFAKFNLEMDLKLYPGSGRRGYLGRGR